MRFTRASGLLLHPTSLAGRFGIGDLGPAAYEFVDFLASAGQTYWQMLPLGPTGYGDSPYSAYSAFAGNYLLISPERLVDDGLLDPADLDTAPDFGAGRVDYGGVIDWKGDIRSRAYARFVCNESDLADAFTHFCKENAWWLDDYVAFRAIKATRDSRPWYEWEASLRGRDPATLSTVSTELEGDIRRIKFTQFVFFRQWAELKRYANSKGIKIIGDIPIFVSRDSSDVWCNRAIFKLDEDGLPEVVAGVPPDYFSETGQLWGNPIYDWEALEEKDFDWWVARLEFNLRLFDIVRLDHFIGFIRNWEVPGTVQTAVNGKWSDVPGKKLFETATNTLGDLPVIVEDLGAMTQEVADLRDAFQFPGMRILQNGFSGDARSGDLPHNYVQNAVAYTGTHDNDPALGWYRSASRRMRHACRKYLHSSGRDISWDMVRGVWASVADTAIVPVQDILSLGSESRMNTPATDSGNWQWRLFGGEFTDEIRVRLGELTETYGREMRSPGELSEDA